MCDVILQVPGLLNSSAGGDIPEHNGFYPPFPFKHHQQSSVQLETFTINSIMRGLPPTPAGETLKLSHFFTL
jgi:hypothetical protein